MLSLMQDSLLCFFQYTDPDSVPLGPIIGVVVGLLVVIAVIAVFVVLRNKKKSGKCDGDNFWREFKYECRFTVMTHV